MVASYDIGEPVRSFVLVPGTGKEKNTQPSCLDLARISTIAGSVPPVSRTSTVAVPPVCKHKSRPPDQEVKELRSRLAALEKQNSYLNQRLANFHHIFRNKQLIDNFVKTLEKLSERNK